MHASYDAAYGCVAGERLRRVLCASSPTLRDLRQRCIMAAVKEGRGGATPQGVRWWLKYTIWGREINPCRLAHADEGLQARIDEELLLCDFVMWLVVCQPSGRKCSARSARKYVSQVQGWHLRHFGTKIGGDVTMHRLRDLVRGAEYIFGRPAAFRRLGVRTQDLHTALQRCLADGSSESQAWRAALTTAFAGLMRGGEFALQDDEAFSPKHSLRRSDLSFFRDEAGVLHAKIMLRPIKKGTNMARVPVVFAAGGSLLDPVAELWRMEKLDPIVDKAARRATPLFRHTTGEAFRVCEVCDLIRNLMQSIGRPRADYGAHSLRIGGATAALAAGVDPAVIRLMGRWSSDIYEIYMRMNKQACVRVTSQVASTAFNDFEAGFQDEMLELLPSELGPLPHVDLDDFTDADMGDGASEDEM